MEQSPIEVLEQIFSHVLEPKVFVSEVLVPEQCMIIYIGDKAYHVTIEEVSNA